MTYDETDLENTSQYVTKDPNSILDFATDWTDWLVGDDTIDTSSWAVPVGLTKTNEGKTDTVATIWLSGGVLNRRYAVVNQITTTQGRTEDRTKYIDIREH